MDGWLSEDSQAWLRANDATLADAFRALRPNGPLDRHGYRTVCTGCGNSVSHPVRWFHDCEFRCSCGSLFDYRDLLRYSNALQQNRFDEAKAIASIYLIEQEPDGHG